MNLATFNDNTTARAVAWDPQTAADVDRNRFRRAQFLADVALAGQFNTEEKVPMAAKRRFVQVFVVDPNELIPLEQSVIYKGEPKLTDATDQELFFELDMKNLLERHNELRVKVVDKKVKDRTEYLEPAKIRDLKMVVVNIAEF